MDNSLYLSRISVDDNRNIKKLYSLAGLARSQMTSEEMTIALDQAYMKLSEFHAGRSDLEPDSEMASFVGTESLNFQRSVNLYSVSPFSSKFSRIYK